MPSEEEFSEVSPAFIVGLDLGMLSDHSALTVLSTVDREFPRRYDVPHLHRWELMVGYEAVVNDVVSLFYTKELGPRHDRYLVVDAGGVGRPVLEMLQRKLDVLSIDVIGVTITAGFDVVRTGLNDYRVPKRDIVGSIQSALGGRRLRVAEGLADAAQLEHELKHMTLKLTQSANQQFESLSERDHDDLVMSLGVALWFADQELSSVDLGRHHRTTAREPDGAEPPIMSDSWGPALGDI
jgi:hypothetical protein